MKNIEPPVIESGIPLPPIRRKTSKMIEDTISSMKIEDSFLILKKQKASIQRYFAKVFGKGSCACRDVDLEYVRVWRIK